MPELPEVEVIARGLDEPLRSRRIERVRVLWPRTLAALSPEAFADAVVGRRCTRVWRRAKYLVFDLDDSRHLLIHLRMSGRLGIEPTERSASPHLRAALELDDGQELRFTDTRKFGRLYVAASVEDATGDLGPEPLEPAFTADWLAEGLHSHRTRLKSLLLDQRFLAGLGNIYVDESLFRAGLHPLRPAESLCGDEVLRLHSAIQSILQEAIALRGATLRDYQDAEGRAGSNQHFLRVYGRAGQPCVRCGQPLVRTVVGQRGTHLCPHCQPEPAGL